MGNYTEISIYVVLETKDQAKRLESIGQEFTKYMTERRAKQGKNGDFSVNIDSVMLDVCDVELMVTSEREENPEWQLEQLFEICKEEFGKNLVKFTADKNVPLTIIDFNRDDEDE